METFHINDGSSRIEIEKTCPNCREPVSKDNGDFSFDEEREINGVKMKAHKYKCKCKHEFVLNGIPVNKRK